MKMITVSTKMASKLEKVAKSQRTASFVQGVLFTVCLILMGTDFG